MGLSFDPANAVFKWLDSRRQTQLHVATYLDEIATEAAGLARVWQGIVDQLIKQKQVNVLENRSAKELVEIPPGQWSNMEPCTRLQAFYAKVSTVLGEKYYNQLDPVVFHIGSILMKRDLTKQLVEAELSAIKQATFFDDAGDVDSIRTVEDSVVALHKEAAALHVLAKSFRAKID